MAKQLLVGKVPVTRHFPGCYRVILSADTFGQVVRAKPRYGWRRQVWRGELRQSQTGSLLRYADWSTTWRGAIQELIDGWMTKHGGLAGE